MHRDQIKVGMQCFAYVNKRLEAVIIDEAIIDQLAPINNRYIIRKGGKALPRARSSAELHETNQKKHEEDVSRLLSEETDLEHIMRSAGHYPSPFIQNKE